MAETIHDLIIIGSGPAGYTAAIYAGRANLKPLVIAGQNAGGAPGGQLMLTSDVENFPGFPEGIQGPDLMDKMRGQAERFGATVITQDVTKVDFKKKPFSLETGSGKTYAARSVIIATGAAAKWLGLESETKLRGHGVSACATCDAAFFRDQRVVVVGGGDSALEEALFLTRFAGHVTVVVRRDSLRASQIMQDRAQKNKKIDFLWNSEVLEINDPAAGRVTGVVIKNSQDNATSEFKTDGVFIAIGHQPNTAVFKGALKLDRVGYLVTTDIVKTSVEGVFAAGDVHDHRYRQAVTAAGFGCAAALEAQRWLEDQASNI